MAQTVLHLEGKLHTYFKKIGYREPHNLTLLREKTQKSPDSDKQAAVEVTALISLFVNIIKAKNVLEIGTFTGYTTLGIALNLPKDGIVLTCENDPNVIKIGEEAWGDANIRNKIDLRIGAALDTLKTLKPNSFDLAFIDADKENYDNYYEECLRLVRPGGVIIIDNTFLSGEVANPKTKNKGAKIIDELNKKINKDKRVEACLIPMSDGLSVVLKN